MQKDLLAFLARFQYYSWVIALLKFSLLDHLRIQIKSQELAYDEEAALKASVLFWAKYQDQSLQGKSLQSRLF